MADEERDFLKAIHAEMEARVINSEEEGETVIAEFAAKGWKMAAISNTGLEPGQARITFMPAKNFTNETKYPEGEIDAFEEF